MRNQPNPKQAFGNKKPRLSLTPMSAQIAQSEAQMDGALKYGEVNWRTDPVEAMTYVDAALRHLRLYENGENLARDTKVRNLGAVMACCAILIDAEVHGTLIDNRNHSPDTCDMLHEAEKMVQHLKDMQAERDKQKPVYDPELYKQFENPNKPDIYAIAAKAVFEHNKKNGLFDRPKTVLIRNYTNIQPDTSDIIGRNCKVTDFGYVPERINAYHDMSQMPEDAFEVPGMRKPVCDNDCYFNPECGGGKCARGK